MGSIRTRLLYAILKATVLCLQGSCANWSELVLEDGAPIGPDKGVAPFHTIMTNKQIGNTCHINQVRELRHREC